MTAIQLDFDKQGGLIPVVVTDHETGQVLMLAYMNEEAWNATLRTGEVHYYSRSRNELWHKGATSGNTQAVRHIHLDCDRDAILLRVEQRGGAACHEGYTSCFFRELNADGEVSICSERRFDPKEVYKK